MISKSGSSRFFFLAVVSFGTCWGSRDWAGPARAAMSTRRGPAIAALLLAIGVADTALALSFVLPVHERRGASFSLVRCRGNVSRF
jgi:hypothetical protein